MIQYNMKSPKDLNKSPQVSEVVPAFEASCHNKPLTYSLDRIKEPTPPTYLDLLTDLASCGASDPIFKQAHQRPTSVLPMAVAQPSDPVNIAHISLQVQVAARNLAALRDEAKVKCENFKQSLEILKEDLEDEDLT